MGSKHKSSKRSRHRDDKDKDKERHRKHKRRRDEGSSRPPPKPHELLIAASLGDTSLCRSLLRQYGANIDWCDAEFTTPLHAASREGHLGTVKFLLRHDARSNMQDLKGNTPAHLAAKNHHLDVVNALLKSKTTGSLKEPNDKGETVEELINIAMAEQSAKAALAQERRDRSCRRNKDIEGIQEDKYYLSNEDEGSLGDYGEVDEEAKWRERLQRELSPDEAGAFYGDDWHADEYETAEEYAKRIWTEMEERKRRKDLFLEAIRKSKERKEEDVRTKEAQQQAQQEQAKSRTFQKEQAAQAADAGWRAAKAAGSASLKLASYEARWEFFCTKNKGKPVQYGDVPWVLPSSEKPSAGELQQVLLHGVDAFEDKRRVLRRELIRWHPDKFIAQFGRVLVPKDREKILGAVTGMSQLLTQLHADLRATK